MLVADMGGHARSLEKLEQVLTKYGPDYSPSRVVEDIVFHLQGLYGNWSKQYADAVLGAILTGRKFYSRSDKVGPYTLKAVEQLGLVRLNEVTKQLDCSLIWLYMYHPGLWRDLAVDPKLEFLQRYLAPEKSPPFLFWPSWEDFTARIWCLKTSFFNGRKMSWYDLHSGATLSHIINTYNMVLVYPYTYTL